MSVIREQKQAVVEEIKDKISKAKSVVFINYQGISVADDTELRNKFRESNVEYRVYKNRLLLRALNDLGIDIFLFFDGGAQIADDFFEISGIQLEIPPFDLSDRCRSDAQ